MRWWDSPTQLKSQEQKKKTPVLSFESAADRDETFIAAGWPCMKLTAESLYYSRPSALSCFIPFPRRLQGPDIKGSGDCSGNITFLWMVFYSYRWGQRICSASSDGVKDWFPFKLNYALAQFEPCISMGEADSTAVGVRRNNETKWGCVCLPVTWYSDYTLHSCWNVSHWG